MEYFHGSPVGGLTELRPSVTKYLGKPAQVCMTTLREMALFYLIDNFEYAYGYDREGNLLYDEYFPDALETLYRGKSGWIYTCAGGAYAATKIPNERVSAQPVKVMKAEYIPDACEAILEAERSGRLIRNRYQSLSSEMLRWVEEQQCKVICRHRLWETETPFGRYMREHYPSAWARALEQKPE